MIDQILQVLGLVVVCYGVWRLVVLFLDDLSANRAIRDVMEGRQEPPWEPRTVRIVREVYDQDHDIR